jgi:hypothetical protein
MHERSSVPGFAPAPLIHPTTINDRARRLAQPRTPLPGQRRATAAGRARVCGGEPRPGHSLGAGDMPGRVRNCEAACADHVGMIHDSDLTHCIELSDADLALVQGGARLPASLIDPTPVMDEETIRRLHEQLNAAGTLAI